jgi:hypothetical protein
MTPAGIDPTLDGTMKIRASAERRIAVPADRVYAFLADFVDHHPQILPEEFGDLVVEHGGYGAGTVAATTLTMGGWTRDIRIRIDEPQPGHVLTETDLASGTVTTFTVAPAPRASSTVRIETAWESGGVTGLVERVFATRFLRDLYSRELELLDLHARREMRLSPRIATANRALVFGGA